MLPPRACRLYGLRGVRRSGCQLVFHLALDRKFLRHNDRYLQANALCGQHVAPIRNKFPVSLADGSDVSVEIEKADGIDLATLLAKSYAPIHLIRQRIPGKSNDRNTVISNPQYVRPLFPEPIHRLVAV